MKKMHTNVGLLDAYLRITLGFMMLGCCAAKKCHPILSLLAGMKIAEGITRFCPCLYLMNRRTKKC